MELLISGKDFRVLVRCVKQEENQDGAEASVMGRRTFMMAVVTAPQVLGLWGAGGTCD